MIDKMRLALCAVEHKNIWKRHIHW